MPEIVTEQTTIAADPATCYAVATDFARYPEWARDLRSVTVVASDDEGRPTEIMFRAAAMGHSTTYTLGYDYTQAPARLAWRLLSGDVTRKLDGYYDFAPDPDDAGATAVSYRLEVELVVPLPAFIKRRTELKIMHTALRELKARVESQP